MRSLPKSVPPKLPSSFYASLQVRTPLAFGLSWPSRTTLQIDREVVEISEDGNATFECTINIFTIGITLSRPFFGTGKVDFKSNRLRIESDDDDEDWFCFEGELSTDFRHAQVRAQFSESFDLSPKNWRLRTQTINLFSDASSKEVVAATSADLRAWEKQEPIQILSECGAGIKTNADGQTIEIDWPSDAEIDEIHLFMIGKCHSIRNLRISALSVSENWLNHLSGLDLAELDLRIQTISAAGAKILTELPALRSLSFDGTNPSREAVQLIARLTELESLGFTDCELDDYDFRELSTLTTLRSLHLDSVSLSDAGFQFLREFQSLQHLAVSSLQTSVAAMEVLPELKELRQLNVQYCPVDTGIQHVSSLPKLESLTLGYCGIDNDSLTVLMQLPLKELSIFSELDNIGLQKISRCQHLECAWLEGGFDDEGVAELRFLKQLKKLSLRSEAVTNEAIARLQNELPNCAISK